jgi:hypothetical protein
MKENDGTTSNNKKRFSLKDNFSFGVRVVTKKEKKFQQKRSVTIGTVTSTLTTCLLMTFVLVTLNQIACA